MYQRGLSQNNKHNMKSLFSDLWAGIIVALVSIPISMGYAQIAGLPSIYGLYASFLPILIFAFLTSTKQFVVGVDAMPAAMVGGLLVAEGILPESNEAMQLVPVIALLVAIWFVIFYFTKAGRIIKFVSTPVMGGFISGVGLTIIFMQIPKLFGAAAGTGEIIELIGNIISQLDSFNLLSLVLGLVTIIIIMLCKRWIPRFPMTVVMMVLGALLQAVFHVSEYGVKLLPQVTSGLPHLKLPDVRIITASPINMLMESLSIAAVIMAQSLLTSKSYADKYTTRIDENRELLAYAGMNMASFIIGGCPINGSVSRTKIADDCGAKSQVMSISAALFMGAVLIFFSPFLQYLPVPILTAIVMTALFGIIDTKMMKRLWQENKGELLIFVASMLAVLFLGTVNGVLVGCLLSFWEVAVRSVYPPTAFLGRIPGHGNFHSLERNSHARPIKNTIIYRFSGNLFFANIDKFEKDIEAAIKDDTHLVVVDARGIGSIDITAVDRLVSFNKRLRSRGIKFYLTEHSSSLNDAIRTMGGGSLIDDGVARITITLALRDAGVLKPYALEGMEGVSQDDYMESEEKLAEFEWAFGNQAEEKLKELAEHTADHIAVEVASSEDHHIAILEDTAASTDWGILGRFDEHEFWSFLQARIEKLYHDGAITEKEEKLILGRIQKRKEEDLEHLKKLNPKAIALLKRHKKN